jgi:ATP adenylyltransferase
VERLWAGWRSEYVRTVDSYDGPCLFCHLPTETDEESLMVERGELCFTVLNRYPYSTGHLMISPYRHVAAPGDLGAAESAEMWTLMTRAIDVLAAAMEPHGFNLGGNLGRVAGAGVPGHLHLHVVPRWDGDTNFMSSIGATRVLPEDLETTWGRLREVVEGPSTGS